MTSQRRRLIDALTTALDPQRFRVSARATAPEYIDPYTLNIRVLTKTITPGVTQGGLTYDMNVWLLTAGQDPDTVDDTLDAGLDELLATFLEFPFVSFRNVERGVMAADDGPAWHGYLFTLTAYGQIEGA